MSITTSSAFINFTNGTPRAEKIIATSNVGIGTSAPAYNLDVSGDINFTGTLYENGVAFSGGGSGIDTTQTLALSNATTGLTVSSNAIVTGNVTAESFIGNTLTLNTVAVTTTLGLDEVLNSGNTSSNTIQITNSTESVSNTTGAIVVSGGVGVGSNLFVGKDLTVDGTVTLNAVSLSTTTNFQEVTNDGNTTTNTVEFNNPTTSLVAASNVSVIKGNIRTDYDVITDEVNKIPLAPLHGPIGREDLYHWCGSGSTAIVNNTSQQNEPFNYNNGFVRTSVVGGSFGTTNYSTKWNGCYLIECSSLSVDTDGNLASPTNYVQLSLPVQYINGNTCSHALFLKFISHDRWSASCVYVTNSDETQVYRLQASTNASHSGGESALNATTSWIGPNGDVSLSHLYHDWQMFSIPEYIVKDYSYNETRDNKSKYQRNIKIRFCREDGGDANLHCSGIAMRTNPYGLTFHNALCMRWSVNGGNATGWFSDNWQEEILGQLDYGSNYTNIYVPICPHKDPDVHGYPDFYLGWMGHRVDRSYELKLKFYLQHSNGTYKYIGRPSMLYKGRYGHFAATFRGQFRGALGLYLHSPDPDYIVKVQGRPYLRLRLDNSVDTWGNFHAHPRGFYTEVVYRDGSSDELGDNGQAYI